MDVDTKVEICSPEVRKGLQRVNWIVQTLVPEVYRLYDGNREGVLNVQSVFVQHLGGRYW